MLELIIGTTTLLERGKKEEAVVTKRCRKLSGHNVVEGKGFKSTA